MVFCLLSFQEPLNPLIYAETELMQLAPDGVCVVDKSLLMIKYSESTHHYLHCSGKTL